MRFSTMVVAAFVGSTIAAPHLVVRQAPATPPATPDVDPKGAGAAKGAGAPKVRGGGNWRAFVFGALATWAVTELKLFGRDLDAIQAKDYNDWNLIDLSEVLADKAVHLLSQEAKPNEATICVDVPYTVENTTLVRKYGGFDLEAGEYDDVYECFLLAGPNRFAVNLTLADPTADSVAVIAGPGQWNETTGVLTL